MRLKRTKIFHLFKVSLEIPERVNKIEGQKVIVEAKLSAVY